jgi:hypothetical protein
MIDKEYTNKLFNRWLLLNDAERNALFSTMFGCLENAKQLTLQDYFKLLDAHISMIEERKALNGE